MTVPGMEPPRYQFQKLDVRTLGISLESIQLLAHAIYQRRGNENGRSVDHWVQAEAELVAGYLPKPAVRRTGGGEPTRLPIGVDSHDASRPRSLPLDAARRSAPRRPRRG